jgi:ADP-ribosylglycohydrolase
MRIAPLGIWGHRIDDNKLSGFARMDSSLSHPNETCCHAAACYVIAIASLMREHGDCEGAFERAWQYALNRGNEEIRNWLEDAEDGELIPFHPQAGFVRIAFTHAFRHLSEETDFVDAIEETLAGGGDTDTNACIVGGLMGAACGAGAIPEGMKRPVLECDTRKGAHPRPSFMETKQIPKLLSKLLHQQ